MVRLVVAGCVCLFVFVWCADVYFCLFLDGLMWLLFLLVVVGGGGTGTVNLTYTDECSGLVVECCSDGSTRQRVVGTGSDIAKLEICRRVTSSGQVIKYLKNGE